MSWNDRNETLGDIAESGFTLSVNGREVPGVYWEGSKGADRLVLLGHGGTTHKKTEYIIDMAQRLCAQGIAAMAIDGPGHGDRPESDASGEFGDRWSTGGGTQAVLEDWSAALDFIEAEKGTRPTGWWGLSMGTMMGLPVTASEERIKVAVLGLMGTWGPNKEDLKRLAPEVSCPVRFLVQWDDEIVPLDTCLELFGMLGTKKKTLHGNPGEHAAVPVFEIAGSVEYLDRYLR